MGTVANTLTEQDVQEAQQRAQLVANAARSVVQSNQFVFLAAFDGTNNDRDDLPTPELQTNVAQLFDQVDLASQTNPNLAALYYRGPGTDGSLPGSSAIPALVTQEVINTATQAYNDFARRSSEWLEANPGGTVTTMVTGFSRGGAPAAIFSQLLYERGLVDPRTGVVLIPPGQVGVSAGVIFDPVTTGVDGNMAFAPNAQNIAVIRAADEFRAAFAAADYSEQPNITTFELLGNHGDIGGFYDRGLGALSLEASTALLRNSGLTIADVPADRRFDPTRPVVIHTEGVDQFDNVIWTETGSRGNRLTADVVTDATRQQFDDGSMLISFTNYRGDRIVGGTDTEGRLVTPRTVAAATDNFRQFGTAIQDLNALVGAIRSGQPLPILSSGLNLIDNQINPVIGNNQTVTNQPLFQTTAVVSAINSLYSLDRAFSGQGSDLDRVSATANAVYSVGAAAQATGLISRTGALAGVSLLGYLDGVIAQAEQASPGLRLGIVPQRLPSITWHEARRSDPGYSIVDVDPLTGEQRHPQLRYNDDFSPYNADPTDSTQRRDLFQRMIDSALERNAIAPEWEVRTALLQQDADDPNAGLTERFSSPNDSAFFVRAVA